VGIQIVPRALCSNPRDPGGRRQPEAPVGLPSLVQGALANRKASRSRGPLRLASSLSIGPFPHEGICPGGGGGGLGASRKGTGHTRTHMARTTG
jgi:hypothetical protein